MKTEFYIRFPENSHDRCLCQSEEGCQKCKFMYNAHFKGTDCNVICTRKGRKKN